MIISKFMATTAISIFLMGGALAQAPMEGGTVTDQTFGSDASVAYVQKDREQAAKTIAYATEEVQRGATVTAISADGQLLGVVSTAGTGEQGHAELSIALDQSLATDTSSATFIGTPDVDEDGRIVIPMSAADFVAAVNR